MNSFLDPSHSNSVSHTEIHEEIQNRTSSNNDKEIHAEIENRVLQKNYPCTAGIQAVVKKEYVLKVYSRFGEAQNWAQLRSDLIDFTKKIQETQSRYLTFFAVFEDSENITSEEEFEKGLWHELSMLTSLEDKEQDWAKNETKDPLDPGFCLGINGEKIFVVGLHPHASRRGRLFSKPTLVFNTFSQFQKFKDDGTYDQLVETTRRRDTKFQGAPNPMALEHGDTWESIQFSGKQNSKAWKCPFHFFSRKDKKP